MIEPAKGSVRGEGGTERWRGGGGEGEAENPPLPAEPKPTLVARSIDLEGAPH